jgi:hypothetical protein
MLPDVEPYQVASLREALCTLQRVPPSNSSGIAERLFAMNVHSTTATPWKALSSLCGDVAVADGIVRQLGTLYDRLDVGPDDFLWSEEFHFPRWSEIRLLAERVVQRL